MMQACRSMLSTSRILRPGSRSAKYGKDVDLGSPAMRAFCRAGRAQDHCRSTLVVWEEFDIRWQRDHAAYATFADISPPASRSWRISGYPLFDG
jgi:hypothetical protein